MRARGPHWGLPGASRATHARNPRSGHELQQPRPIQVWQVCVRDAANVRKILTLKP